MLPSSPVIHCQRQRQTAYKKRRESFRQLPSKSTMTNTDPYSLVPSTPLEESTRIVRVSGHPVAFPWSHLQSHQIRMQLEGKRKASLTGCSIHFNDRRQKNVSKRTRCASLYLVQVLALTLFFLFVMSTPCLHLIRMSRSHPMIVFAVTSLVSANPSANSPSGSLTRPVISTSSRSSSDTASYPFLSPSSTVGERRLSPRTVTTKYGSLRGVTISLPNRNLQQVEAFLGEFFGLFLL